MFLYSLSLKRDKMMAFPMSELSGIKDSFQITACEVMFLIGSAIRRFVFLRGLSSFFTSVVYSILIKMQTVSNS